MARLVAIDTSTWWGGVALLEAPPEGGPAEVIAEIGLGVADSHAMHVLSLLEQLMTEAGWSRSHVEAYAATRGPGSFTGLRVGLGTIRGLALASGAPCYGVGTLEALAESFGPCDRERVPMLDAGRNEVYAARYTPESRPPAEIVSPSCGPPDRTVQGVERQIVTFGPGATRHRERLERLGVTVRQAPRSIAAATGALALGMAASGAPDGTGVAPLYIRPPDAVVKQSGR